MRKKEDAARAIKSPFAMWSAPLESLLNRVLKKEDSAENLSETSAKIAAKWEELLTINSLTMGLKSLNAPFEVEILHLGESSLFCDESPAMNRGGDVISSQHHAGNESHTYAPGGAVFVREVFLKLAGVPVVWARSVIDQDAEDWLKILDCGTQPLGHKLFDGSLPITRSPFEYGVIDFGHPMLAKGAVLSERGILVNSGTIVARRSTFDWAGAPLLLTECYLPTLERFIERC